MLLPPATLRKIFHGFSYSDFILKIVDQIWLLVVYFLLHFHYFGEWVNCVMIHINANFLISQDITYFLHERPNICSLSQKCFGTLHRRSFKSIRFLPHFYKFGEWLRCVINISDVYDLSLPNIDIFMQESRLPFPKKFDAKIAKVFGKILHFPHFLLLFTRVRCVLFEINSGFLLVQQVLIFLHKRPYINDC